MPRAFLYNIEALTNAINRDIITAQPAKKIETPPRKYS